jgi:Leucine-rich repeat (LRR) protein
VEIYQNGYGRDGTAAFRHFTGMELTSYAIPFKRPLYTFDLSSNRLQGQIPMPSLSARFLDYSHNIFSSVLPNFTLYLSYTYYLSLSQINISSYLPNSICDSYMDVLDVSYNSFKGMVPPCLMENGFMSILNLRENQFEGVLPSNISSGCSLQTLNLYVNKIEGQLPRALYNCTNLEVLDLGWNQIMDTFPSCLGSLSNLRVLVLRSNQFHGSIQDEKSEEKFPSLQILDLASNNFSGNLHPRWFKDLTSMEKYNNTGQLMGHQNVIINVQFYQDTVTISYKGLFVTFERILTALTAIDLSDNALEGSIPALIGKLVSLHVLNMSHNTFTGEIPHLFGGMAALESLDLSSNMLSGEIPQELTNLTFLSILNLSNNQPEGRIPQSRQFTTFQNDSFDGNTRLCGPPLSKQCGTPDNPNGTHLNSSPDGVDIVLFLFAGVGFGMGFAAAILVKPGWIKKMLRNANSVNMI